MSRISLTTFAVAVGFFSGYRAGSQNGLIKGLEIKAKADAKDKKIKYFPSEFYDPKILEFRYVESAGSPHLADMEDQSEKPRPK